MDFRDNVYIAGAFEHPTREAPEKTIPQLHAEVARGALDDAGLHPEDVDAYFSAGDAPGIGVASMADYLGLDCRHLDSTETGGSSHLVHVGHALEAIATGHAEVALITLAGRPRSGGMATGTGTSLGEGWEAPHIPFENVFGNNIVGEYAMAARRHMHEFGTTSEQLAEIKVAAAYHAQHNEHALYPDPVTVEEVVDSRMIADPLHLLDCCVITDGGGALLVVSPDVAGDLDRDCVKILGYGEGVKHQAGGRTELTTTAAVESGDQAFQRAQVDRDDIDYVSIYDSFTITVLQTLEDLGFCEKGEGGAFVEDGTLQAPDGALPFNTDGGGLCSNHPANRGGMTKAIETVRQLRDEAHPKVQVPGCEVGLSHGTGGGSMATRIINATLILGVEDA